MTLTAMASSPQDCGKAWHLSNALKGPQKRDANDGNRTWLSPPVVDTDGDLQCTTTNDRLAALPRRKPALHSVSAHHPDREHQATEPHPQPAMALIRHDTLERVGHFLSKPRLRVYRDLKGMCERVSDSYRDRVVTELVQNAHDAHPPGSSDGRVHLALDPREGPFGTLYVANDGTGFTRDNFEALCSPTLTTKNVNEAIGNKGVGFLSVFQVSSHPEVYSRAKDGAVGFDGFCFSFAADETLGAFLREEGLGDHAGQVIANMPRLYLACPATDRPGAVGQFASDGFATVIRLPLKAADALEAVQAQLARLANESPPMQLFLTRLAELSCLAGAWPARRRAEPPARTRLSRR